jgi:hypothetical protein
MPLIPGMENGRATVTAIRAWTFPVSGTLQFDFVSYRAPSGVPMIPESFAFFMDLLRAVTPATSRQAGPGRYCLQRQSPHCGPWCLVC